MIAPDSKIAIGWPSVGGAYLQEFGPELRAFANMNRNDVVFPAKLLKQDGDLVAIGRRPEIDIDHVRSIEYEGRGQSHASDCRNQLGVASPASANRCSSSGIRS